MKGIILAGGSGTRLYPATEVLNKHLLTIYDKPMVYYPLSTLMLANIKDILLITTPYDLPLFKNLLQDGARWGINISYAIQEKPNGIAEAFIIGEKFIGSDSVCLILGDNIIHADHLNNTLFAARKNSGATIFGYHVSDPERYGVAKFDNNGVLIDILEKPTNPPSNFAITGLYFYDNDVIKIAKSLQPSQRGELEITDVNRVYLQNKKLNIKLFGRGVAWLDTGTHDSLLEASEYIAILEKRNGLKVGCPEEIAWRMGFISEQELLTIANKFIKSGYGNYLLRVLHERY